MILQAKILFEFITLEDNRCSVWQQQRQTPTVTLIKTHTCTPNSYFCCSASCFKMGGISKWLFQVPSYKLGIKKKSSSTLICLREKEACVISKQEAWGDCSSVMRTSFGFTVEQGGCITGGSEGSISPLARRVKTPGETSIVGMDVSSSIFQLEHKVLCQAVKLGFMRLHARLKTLRGLEFTRWLTACLFSRTPQKTLQTFDLSCGRRTCARSHLLCWGFSGANAYFSAGAFLFLIFESVRSSFIFIQFHLIH